MSEEILKSPIGLTKNDLWARYKALAAVVKDKAADAPVSTVKVAEQKKIDAAVKSASAVDTDAIEALTTQVLQLKGQFGDLTTAIEAKKQELQTIHQIEVDTNTLVVLAATKEELIKEASENADNLLARAEMEAEAIVDEAQEKANQLLAEVKEKTEAAKLAQQREQEQYDYDFNRKKIANLDILTDEINAINKVNAEREEVINAKETAVAEREAKQDALEQQLTTLEQTMEAKILEAAEKAKETASKSASFQTTLLKKDYEAKEAIANSEIASLQERVFSLKADLDRANSRIAEAQREMAELAKASFRAQGDAATITKVSEIAANSGKK